jgi:hypothetical protein
MGLTYDDITHSGQSLMVAYSDWDRLRIYSGSQPDDLGGQRPHRRQPAVVQPSQEEPGVQNKQFFPLRIRTTDIDRDGKG